MRSVARPVGVEGAVGSGGYGRHHATIRLRQKHVHALAWHRAGRRGHLCDQAGRVTKGGRAHPMHTYLHSIVLLKLRRRLREGLVGAKIRERTLHEPRTATRLHAPSLTKWSQGFPVTPPYLFQHLDPTEDRQPARFFLTCRRTFFPLGIGAWIAISPAHSLRSSRPS